MSHYGPLTTSLLVITLAMALSSCDVRKYTRGALTDIRADLQASDAETLGWAAECALAQSPQALVHHVPALLEHLSDTRVYRVVAFGGGLIGVGEAGPRALSVGQTAGVWLILKRWHAVRSAVLMPR